VCVWIDARNRRQTVFLPGANERLTPEDLLALTPSFADADLVLVQLEIPMECAQRAVQLGRAAGARVVLDCAPAQPLSEELLTDLHLVHANASEAEVLTGLPVSDRESAVIAAENLLRRGASAAAVAAPGGNVVVTWEQHLWLPHLPVEVMDTTGAGDAFSVALALGVTEGLSWSQAAARANAAAALTTTRLGALPALPRREEVLRLLRELPASLAVAGPCAL
jgi:ribokinase